MDNMVQTKNCATYTWMCDIGFGEYAHEIIQNAGGDLTTLVDLSEEEIREPITNIIKDEQKIQTFLFEVDKLRKDKLTHQDNSNESFDSEFDEYNQCQNIINMNLTNDNIIESISENESENEDNNNNNNIYNDYLEHYYMSFNDDNDDDEQMCSASNNYDGENEDNLNINYFEPKQWCYESNKKICNQNKNNNDISNSELSDAWGISYPIEIQEKINNQLRLFRKCHLLSQKRQYQTLSFWLNDIVETIVFIDSNSNYETKSKFDSKCCFRLLDDGIRRPLRYMKISSKKINLCNSQNPIQNFSNENENENINENKNENNSINQCENEIIVDSDNNLTIINDNIDNNSNQIKKLILVSVSNYCKNSSNITNSSLKNLKFQEEIMCK